MGRVDRASSFPPKPAISLHHRDKPSALLWPRKRTVLERIAAGYEVEAEREGQSAEQRDS
jgi:hypothetical protein